MTAAGAKGLTWADFVSACSERINVDSYNWRGVIAKHLHLSQTDLAHFERVNRVPMTALKDLKSMPNINYEIHAKKSRRTGFSSVMGELVRCARAGGMTPTAIFDALNDFREHFVGQITPNMILGDHVADNSGKILPENDGSPIQRSEIISMQTSLWGNANGLRPMERFIFTHTQVDVAGYMKNDSLFNLAASDCKRLRQRYWIEVRLREKNQRYAKFARGLALLEKRTKEVARHKHGGLSPDEARLLVVDWFGLTKSASVGDIASYIAQLCGYDHFTVEQAFVGSRRLPQALLDTMAVVTGMVKDCNPDDADFEAKAAEWVKKHQRQKHPSNE